MRNAVRLPIGIDPSLTQAAAEPEDGDAREVQDHHHRRQGQREDPVHPQGGRGEVGVRVAEALGARTGCGRRRGSPARR